MTQEERRLEEARDPKTPWKKWGPYLAELAGISDDQQRLCFALALWNRADPILKERLFGLVHREGNGENVTESYFTFDSTPTHSYLKYLYKYLGGHRYFDVFVEYAKAAPEDVLVRISIVNRGPEVAVVYLLPTLWFRNTWSCGDAVHKPSLALIEGPNGVVAVAASHPDLGERFLYCERVGEVLFSENGPWGKDAFHEYVVHNRRDAVSSSRRGTKAAALYPLAVGAGHTAKVRLRLTATPAEALAWSPFGPEFESDFETRLREADEFYDVVTRRRSEPTS